MHAFRMKRALPLVLSLAAALLLTACGNRQAPADVPDAPAEPPAQYSSQEPFAAYLDLSKLSQETLDACTQVIDQESTSNDVTIRVKQVFGDAMILYVAYEVIYPQDMDLSDPAALAEAEQNGYNIAHVSLVEGTFTDPKQAVQGNERHYSSAGINASQVGSNTMAGIASFTFREPVYQGKDVSMVFFSGAPGQGEPTHVFSWTLNTGIGFRTTELNDSAGNAAGTVSLSPFGFYLVLNTSTKDGDALLQNIALLDSEGQPIEVGQSGSGNDGDHQFESQFFIPVELDMVKTIQAGPYTGTF